MLDCSLRKQPSGIASRLGQFHRFPVIRCDLHRSLAQAPSIGSFISSIDKDGPY
jgi:hypothetical protein